MIEIFKNLNYDFMGKRKYFAAFSLIVTLLCFGSFLFKGFNMGIDFTGGTLVNVLFKNSFDDSRIRSALSKRGIDASQVVIQPISSRLGESQKNEVLIRMPQASSESAKGGIDADKRAIMEALTQYYSDVSGQSGANKIDLNNSPRDTIKNKLLELDKLGYRKSMGDAGAEQEYGKIASHIVDYRDNKRGGIMGDVSDIPVAGFPPQLGDALKADFYAGDFNIVNAEIVGPQVGEELRNRAIYVTLAALAGMLVYIALRFEWIYGVSAITATFHDVIVTLGFFSIFGWEISLTVIAALLTLIGYSMNDTIVIFDRIREMLKLKRRENINKLSNDAINETMSRTVITGGLTFVSVVVMAIVGGSVLRYFALTLVIGILIGTYSSIAIATPVMLAWKQFTAGRADAAKAAETAARSKPNQPKPSDKPAPKAKSGGSKSKTSKAKA